MSFDVNIGRAQPMIKAASGMNNDGGSGGNTGYMMQGRRKKDEQRRSLFTMESDSGEDSFVMVSKISEDNDSKDSWFGGMVKKFLK